MKSWLQRGRFSEWLNRLLKNDDCGLRKEGPGLKPLVFAVLFAGLKPCAPSQKQNQWLFPQPVKPRWKQVPLVQLKPRSFETMTFRRLLDTRME
jgi:hypothetical protein